MGTSTPSVRARGARRRPPHIEDAPLGLPLFILNLKSYPSALGLNAERIGAALESQARESRVSVALAPAPGDVGRLARTLQIPVIAQHVDPLDAGAHTGYFVPEAARILGAQGSLLNHSEHRLPAAAVARGASMLRSLDLAAVVCARDASEAARLARIHPPYLAVEPPELIGTGRSVSRVRPEVIRTTVRRVRAVSPETHVLCGAGVVNREDVRKALELEAEGILVASAVTLAADPAQAIRELLSGFHPD